MIATLAATTRGAAEATLNISSVAMLLSVLRDLHWTLTSLVSISSRTRRSRCLFIEESITTTPLALFLLHSPCDIRFRAPVLRLMHGPVSALYLAAAKGTLFTCKAHRTHSLSMRRPNISAAKPRRSANLAPAWNSGSRDTLVGLTT